MAFGAKFVSAFAHLTVCMHVEYTSITVRLQCTRFGSLVVLRMDAMSKRILCERNGLLSNTHSSGTCS